LREVFRRSKVTRNFPISSKGGPVAGEPGAPASRKPPLPRYTPGPSWCRRWPHDDSDDAHDDLIKLREKLAHDTRPLAHHSDHDAKSYAEDQHP